MEKKLGYDRWLMMKKIKGKYWPQGVPLLCGIWIAGAEAPQLLIYIPGTAASPRVCQRQPRVLGTVLQSEGSGPFSAFNSVSDLGLVAS